MKLEEVVKNGNGTFRIYKNGSNTVVHKCDKGRKKFQQFGEYKSRWRAMLAISDGNGRAQATGAEEIQVAESIRINLKQIRGEWSDCQ